MSKTLFILVFLCTLKVQANPFKGFSGSSLSGFSGSFLSPDSIIKPERKHSPRAATIMSMALPGLGQAYNKKYWKIPVIYAALGISGYYILRNRDSMKQRQDALTVMLDGDSTTNPPGKYAKIPTDVLKAQRNLYRTNRDYSIIIFAGFYLLNIVDAAVDAHFYNFNIDKPLAMQRHKNWHIYSSRIGNTPAVGLSWTF